MPALWNDPVKCFKICHIFGTGKTQIFFILCTLFPNECPGLYIHSQKIEKINGHSKNKVEAFHKVISTSINLFIYEECQPNLPKYRTSAWSHVIPDQNPKGCLILDNNMVNIHIYPSNVLLYILISNFLQNNVWTWWLEN